MKVSLELDIFKLIGKPEFGVNVLVEFNNSLVVFGLGHIRGLNEKGNPFVSSITVKVSGVEVISVNEVATSFIEISDDVDLLSRVNVVLSNALVDKSDKSALFVESCVSANNLV